MRRRRAAAATNDIDEARTGKLPDKRCHGIRRVVVTAKFVGQPCIGMCADQRIGGSRNFTDIGAKLFGAQGTVQPDRKRIGVTNGMPEGLRRLTGERAPRKIGDGAGNPHRNPFAQIIKRIFDRCNRGLGVQGVEDRFDHQHVAAARQEAKRGLLIRSAKLIERDVAEGRIIHIR